MKVSLMSNQEEPQIQFLFNQLELFPIQLVLEKTDPLLQQFKLYILALCPFQFFFFFMPLSQVMGEIANQALNSHFLLYSAA